MKSLFLLLILGFGAAGGSARAQTTQAAGTALRPAASADADTLLVEAACGQCRLGLPGKGCDLAVRLSGGRAYFVTGTGIDAHGDAHADDGFCNAVRQARVRGKVVANQFNVSYFQLLPAPATPKVKFKP
ncbi:DUF6370 family protein [uncultured Hymenobacter sp.]|uniref:DUF6370 family protein n=1 Tax=uncultured Hymenobacter sp. TaxID=170016 RepID=UPI0035CBFB19